MPNLTITVDENTLRRARIKALERGESVNSYLAEMLKSYAGGSTQAEVMADLRKLSDSLDSGSGPEGRTWTRDELHRY